MIQRTTVSPWRVLLPVGLGTGLSLLGDAGLYAVLPTHTADAGITMAAVGILLSVNRFIRLGFNGPVGWLYDRLPRRTLFVPALFIGAASTAIYALAPGFWLLLTGRLLWGLAWVGIWVGGNAIILDISQPETRGRWVGLYQTAFFLGASSGAILGGLLTDGLGYHRAMAISAGLTFLGAVVTFFYLPETRSTRDGREESPAPLPADGGREPGHRLELAAAMALLGVNRLVLAGILTSTLGLLLLEQLGSSIRLAGLTIGVATLTGLGLGLNSFISMVAAPLLGRLSDWLGRRWAVISGGLLAGLAGFGLLAAGAPWFVVGLPLAAIGSGSNQGLSTTLVGDLTGERQRGRQLGLLFTVGDLASAIGPPLAYSLIPWLGLRGVYLFSAAAVAAMLAAASYWAVKKETAHGIPH